MDIRGLSLVVVSVCVLSVSACGSGDDAPDPGRTSVAASSEAAEGVGSEGEGHEEGGGMGPDGVDQRGPVPEVDVAALGAKLKGWEGCDEDPIVDMAGYTKVVCIIPDEHAVPGQDGNAVSIMAFDEWAQADEYVDSYGDPEVTHVGEGFIVDGPHREGVDAAVEVLEG